MFKLLTSRLYLLLTILLINKLLVFLISKEKLIIIYLWCSTAGEIALASINELFSTIILAQKYQNLIKKKLNRIAILIKLRGITDFNLSIKIGFVYLFCLEIALNKILLYSIIFSECLYLRNSFKFNNYLFKFII